MNENIDNMFDELRKEFLDSYNKELYLVIHNEVCDDYYVDQYESQDNRTRRSRK